MFEINVVKKIFSVLCFLLMFSSCSKDEGNIAGKKSDSPFTVTLPCLIDFGMDGCAPCKELEPILEEIKEEYKGKLGVVYIDAKKEPQLARKFNLSSVPTQLFVDKNYEQFFMHNGFISKEDIIKIFEEKASLSSESVNVVQHSSLDEFMGSIKVSQIKKEKPKEVIKNEEKEEIVVYYLTGDMRSGCSSDIEDSCDSYIDEFLEKEYAWETLSIEEEKNQHLITDFKIDIDYIDWARGACVITQKKNGKFTKFVLMDDLVSYKDDEQELSEYVKSFVQKFKAK